MKSERKDVNKENGKELVPIFHEDINHLNLDTPKSFYGYDDFLKPQNMQFMGNILNFWSPLRIFIPSLNTISFQDYWQWDGINYQDIVTPAMYPEWIEIINPIFQAPVLMNKYRFINGPNVVESKRRQRKKTKLRKDFELPNVQDPCWTQM